MKKNIAIIIRGQFREWNNAKHSILSCFGRMNIPEVCEVTFFFATWDKSYNVLFKEDGKPIYVDELEITEEHLERIRSDFETAGLNLWKAKIFNYSDVKSSFCKDLKFYEEYELISFIRYAGSLLKQEYENEHNIIFDTVIHIRPDVFYLPALGKHRTEFLHLIPRNTIISTTGIHTTYDGSLLFDHFLQVENFSIDDIIFASGSLASDILCNEFLSLYDKSYISTNFLPHNKLCDYLLRTKQIMPDNGMHKYIANSGIIRPSRFFDKQVDFTNISEATLKRIKVADSNFHTEKDRYFKS